MSTLQKLISQLCPEGVEYVRVGHMTRILRGKRLTKNQLSNDEKYPVLHGGLEPLGYYSKSNRNAHTVMVINVGASAGTVGYSDVDFWSSDGCFCINKSDKILDKYMYYALLCCQSVLRSKVRVAGIPTLDNKVIEDLKIPIPPLPIQQEIVRILDTFTALIEALTAELTARKKQYAYYRDKLLTFGDEVEQKTLGEVCVKTSNIKWKDTEEEYYYIDLTSVDRETNEIRPEKTINSENAPSRAQQIVMTDDVLFATTRPTLQRYCFVPEKYGGHICSTGYCVLRANKDVIVPKFLYYTITAGAFYHYIENNQEGTSYPCISDSKVKKYKFCLPSLEEQIRIVAILDRFDALVHDLTNGLPAEIEARRKQYDYYRDRLLSFPKKGAG